MNDVLQMDGIMHNAGCLASRSVLPGNGKVRRGEIHVNEGLAVYVPVCGWSARLVRKQKAKMRL